MKLSHSTRLLHAAILLFLLNCKSWGKFWEVPNDKKVGNTGTVEWVRTVSAGTNASLFRAVGTDSAGSIYAAGYQIGNSVFTYGNQNATGINSVSYNATLIKYDAQGNTLWAKTVTAGADESQFQSIAIDSAGNIYVAGYQRGNSVFNYGGATVAGNNSTGQNAILVKYDSAGTALWAQSTSSGSSNSIFASVAVDTGGNVYAAGLIAGSTIYTFGGQTVGGVSSTAGNAVLVKYNSSGVAQWAQSDNVGSNASQLNAVAADASGNIYVSGWLYGNTVIGFSGKNVSGSFATGNNALLMKYDALGNTIWAQSVGGASNASEFHTLATDKSGNIYAAGFQIGNATFSYGGQNITGTDVSNNNVVLVKYDAAGNPQWGHTVSSGANASAFSGVAVDIFDNIYAVGYQITNGIFSYGNQSIAGVFAGYNISLVKYTLSGLAEWARTVSAGANDSAFLGVATDNNGNVYTAGNQYGTGSFTYGNQSAAGTYATGNNALLIKYR